MSYNPLVDLYITYSLPLRVWSIMVFLGVGYIYVYRMIQLLLRKTYVKIWVITENEIIMKKGLIPLKIDRREVKSCYWRTSRLKTGI